jgi:hypothetical protein
MPTSRVINGGRELYLYVTFGRWELECGLRVSMRMRSAYETQALRLGKAKPSNTAWTVSEECVTEQRIVRP